MKDKQILEYIRILQREKASEHLHEKVHSMVSLLPEKHSGFYFPLFAFRLGIVAMVLILCIVATSGVIVAAQQSRSGTPLYPVKVLMQRVVPAFIQQKQVQGIVAPTPTPTMQAVTPSPTSSVDEQKKEKKNEHVHNEDGGNRMENPIPTWVHEIRKTLEDHQEHQVDKLHNTSDVNKHELNLLEKEH